MANTKQAKKAIRKTARKTSFNKWWKAKISKAKKAFEDVLKTPKTQEEALELLKTLQKVVDKAAKKKVINKNKAARIKSRSAKKLNTKLTK